MNDPLNADVAAELGVTPDAMRMAKSRVLRRLLRRAAGPCRWAVWNRIMWRVAGR